MPSNQTLMFCIGAQKAGTTWLERQLETQDDVFLAKPKELHYWDCIRAPYLEHFKDRARQRLHIPMPGDALRYRMSRFWRPELRERIAQAEQYSEIYGAAPYDHSKYLAYLGLGSSKARLVGDITPSYALLSRSTFAEMFACSSDTRFVFIMRDPVRRLWSGLHQRYYRELKRGTISQEDLERRFDEVCNDPFDSNFQRSDYMRTIGELEAAVPVSNIHYCFYETLLDPKDGDEERGNLADFLRVSPDCLNAQERVHAARHSLQLDASRQRVAREHMVNIYDALLAKFGSRLPRSWY